MSNRWAHVFGYLLLLLCLSCSFSPRSVKFDQYYAEGEALYARHCSNCHQVSGKGLGLVYPPLNPSDYLDQHFDAVLCQMKYGTKGEMIVNGASFNKPMPGVRSLTELEIAEIATYIGNTWGHKRGLVELDSVRRVMERCDQ